MLGFFNWRRKENIEDTMQGRYTGSVVTLALCLAFFLNLSFAIPTPGNGIGQTNELRPDNEIFKRISKRHAFNEEDTMMQSGIEHRNQNLPEIQAFVGQANANMSPLSNITMADYQSDRTTQLRQMRYRERRKQERLESIKAQIFQSFRISRPPNISSNDVFSEEDQGKINVVVQNVNDINKNDDTENDYHQHESPTSLDAGVSTATPEPRLSRPQSTMQWLQSFYPSCDLQNNTDREVWELPETFRVHYGLPLKRYILGSKVTLLLAKLRLHKTNKVRKMVMDDAYDTFLSGESEIIVSVYQLLRPLRFNKRERKRLVDTAILPVSEEGWIEFNVLPTLNFWLHHPHKNYGFDIEVEDDQGNKVDPNVFFRNMDCSLEETESQKSPFPNLMGIYPGAIGENESSLFDRETYPTLDVQMADVATAPDHVPTGHFAMPPMFPHSRRSNAEQQRTPQKRHLYHPCSNTDICQKETINITFAELGLGGVISPLDFEWTFCSRNSLIQLKEKISKQQQSSSVLHHLYTVWKLLMKKNDGEQECVESGWKSLSILHFDKEYNIKYELLEYFLPTSCLCRIS